MDPFMSFPDEIITKICNDLTTPELVKTAKASSKVYQVCSDIIKERRPSYEQKMEKYLLSNNNHLFLKTIDNDTSKIMIYFHNKYVTITQNSSSNIFPWLIKEFEENPSSVKFQVLILKDTQELRKRIAKALVDQGYTVNKAK